MTLAQLTILNRCHSYCRGAATAEDICMFFFATADSGLAAEEAARDKAKAASGAAVPTGGLGRAAGLCRLWGAV